MALLRRMFVFSAHLGEPPPCLAPQRLKPASLANLVTSVILEQKAAALAMLGHGATPLGQQATRQSPVRLAMQVVLGQKLERLMHRCVKTVPWVVGPLRKASANVIYALLGGLDIRLASLCWTMLAASVLLGRAASPVVQIASAVPRDLGQWKALSVCHAQVADGVTQWRRLTWRVVSNVTLDVSTSRLVQAAPALASNVPWAVGTTSWVHQNVPTAALAVTSPRRELLLRANVKLAAKVGQARLVLEFVKIVFRDDMRLKRLLQLVWSVLPEAIRRRL